MNTGQNQHKHSTTSHGLQQRSAAAGAEMNPLLWVHQLLRGRYHWAILLAGALAAGAAYLEHQRVELLYETTGEIELRADIPRLLYSTESTGRMRDFDNFVAQQVRLLQGDRVTAMAMSSDEWRALDRPYTEEAERDFQEALRVRQARESGLIMVSFRDPQHDVTRIAVQAVIESYQRLYEETDPTLNRRRMQLLDERRLSLSNQMSSLRSQIRGFGDVFGPDGVRFRHQQTSARVRELDGAIERIDMAVAEVQRRIEQGPPPMTIEQIAEHNPRVAELREQLEDRRRRLALNQEHGNESAVAVHQERISQIERQIEREVAEFDPAASEEFWRQQQEETLEELAAEREVLARRLEQNRAQLSEVGEERRRLEQLEAEAADVQSKLERVEREIEQLNVESAMGERLSVPSYGRTRNSPINEDEPAKRAMIGGVAGGGLGVGLVMLVGLLNPRLRRSYDLATAQGEPKVLGMLPHLSSGAANGKMVAEMEAGNMSRCVHQIRMFLQLESRETDVRSFVISGPVPGTGKTSLVMALGLSYAAAGARTLLVDFDIIGSGLTRRLDVGRQKRLGRLLQERGLVSAGNIARVAEDITSGKRLGQKLVDRKLIAREQIDAVLEAQAQSRAGLLDVLAGEPLGNCVISLPIENLSLLSAGNANAEQISQVGRMSVQRLLEQVRQSYDVILIDTGPLPGSVEASIVAAEADRVVVCASRGDQVRRLNTCLQFLDSIGARVAGVVYNRADRRDMARSVYGYSNSSSMRSAAADNNGHPHPGSVADTAEATGEASAGAGGKSGM